MRSRHPFSGLVEGVEAPPPDPPLCDLDERVEPETDGHERRRQAEAVGGALTEPGTDEPPYPGPAA